MSENEKKCKLSPSQEIVIQSILSGKNVTSACTDGKVSRTAYYNWLKESPQFQDELTNRRSEIVETSMNKLRSLMDEAVDKLHTLMKSENQEVARKSASAIIEYVLKTNETMEIEDRLDEVERLFLERRTYSK